MKKWFILSKLRSLLGYFYNVPWCVPAWGWPEFSVTLKCILTGHIIEGPYSRRFADAVKDYLGLPYALPVSRGRVAIELALRAMGLTAKDDVVLPSYTCQTVLEAVLRVGARPVFADVAYDLHLTPECVKDAITPKTRCVIVPHLFDKTAPINEIEVMLNGTRIALIDDAAQMFGSRCSGRLIGTFGDCGIVSCGPGKALAGPAGGLLVTRNREFYERATEIPLVRASRAVVTQRILSFWIWRRLRKYTLPFKIVIDRIFGVEEQQPYVACTLSNLDAAIALQQFHALGENYRKRRRNADVLLQLMGSMARHTIHDFSHDTMLLKLVLVLPTKGRTSDQMIRLFANAGIECQTGYSPLHHRTPTVSTSLPTTEDVWKRIVCIPIDIHWKNNNRLSDLLKIC